MNNAVPGLSRLLFCTAVLWYAGGRVLCADQIVLKDGDRVTGEIVKKDGKVVTMQSKNFGRVTVNWDDIATVLVEKPLNVGLSGNRNVKATIQTHDGQLRLSTAQGPEDVGREDVISIRNDVEEAVHQRYLKPGILDLWTITGSLNIAGTKGNSDASTLTTPINFVRASKTTRTTAYFNSIRSTATLGGVSAQTAKAVRGGWAHGRNLSRKVLATAFNDYEFDAFQFLDLRVVLGGGLGYQFWTRESGQLVIVGGAAWNREKFSPLASPAFVRNSAEAYWGDDFNYKLNTRTNLVQVFRMFNNLSNTGAYRMNFDVTASTRLTKWLTWNVSFSDRYLSNPVQGRKKNDMLYTTGLGFVIAR